MIITTTNSIEGHSIREYRGIAFGEVITGIDMFRDLGASLTNIFGGRSAGYEDELQNARASLSGAQRTLGPTPWSAWTSTTRSSARTTAC